MAHRCRERGPSTPSSALDSPLEGNGFELVVPREIDGGFETSSELGEPSSARRVSSGQSSASANRQSSCGGSNAATHRRMKAAKLSAAASIAELKVRIHSPPAESQQRTLRDVVHALMIGARCSVVEPAQLLQAVVVDPPRHAVDIMMKPPCVRMFMPNRISLVSISPVPLCQRGYRAHGVLCSLAPIRGFSSSSRTRNMPPAVSTFALTHHRATNALASVASAK